ncbi:MAG: hypothetical protein PUP92_00940 [Rhizonema sp. PD38]|nr:hypothetical protein [Rhizonema sp. PD38]
MYQPTLLDLLKQSSWDYGLSSSGAWLNVPSQSSASLISDLFFNDLTATAAKLRGKVQIFWGDRTQHPIEIEDWMHQLKEANKMTAGLPGLYLGTEIKVYGSNFLRMLLELIERKDENAGIARLRDNKQLILTAGSATAMGLEDATPLTNLRREDYWNLEDLAEFNREWQQQLREDGTNSIEFTYRALDNPLDSNGGWVRQTTRYSLFVDGAELYHRAQALDVVAVQ